MFKNMITQNSLKHKNEQAQRPSEPDLYVYLTYLEANTLTLWYRIFFEHFTVIILVHKFNHY